MSEEQQELLYDLLTKKAIYGLDEAEQRQLDEFDRVLVTDEFNSLEMTTAAIGLAGLAEEEPLPSHLFSKIAADSKAYVGTAEPETKILPEAAPVYGRDEIFGERPSKSWFGWFGWVAAAVACIALAVNIGLTRFNTNDVARNTPPVNVSRDLTAAELRDQMLQAATDTVRAAWTAGNVKELSQVVGDIVWSDEKQTGYMRIQGLPANDTAKETYQLWIFDKTQDAATPIDGGTFDIKSGGEVVIPINAKLKARGPQMFAITIEKPGGVVVSKRGKIAALAKVETPTG
ncbi:MAG: anti-sigma factor [Acidobacteriota bacterium]